MLLAAAPFLVGRLVEPRARPQAVVLVHLGVFVVILAALLGLLVFLFLFFLPAPLATRLGITCMHSSLCPHALPLWGQFVLWSPVVGLMIWLAATAGGTVFSGLLGSRRVRRFAVEQGERLSGSGRYPVYQVRDERVFACVAGWIRPVVVISSGIRRALDPRQMDVVLVHEQAHAKGFHNLVLLAARAAQRALFFVPGVKAAGAAIRRSLEAIADDASAVQTGDALSVAGAVTQVARLSTRRAETHAASVEATLPAFTHDDLAVHRVERLLFGWPHSGSRLRVLTSAVALVLLVLVVGSSGYAISKSGLSGGSQAALCHLQSQD